MNSHKNKNGSMSSHKDSLRDVYNKHVDEFAERFGEYFAAHGQALLDAFITLLPANAAVLDLGCGPGHYSARLLAHNMKVLCVDISSEMVARCTQLGLDAEIGDIENLSLGGKVFDGIWMHTSLVHVPRKTIPKVVVQLRDHLVPSGILGVTVWEGTGEGARAQDADKYGDQRWYTYFSDEDIRHLFSDHFDVGPCHRNQIAPNRVSLTYNMTAKEHN